MNIWLQAKPGKTICGLRVRVQFRKTIVKPVDPAQWPYTVKVLSFLEFWETCAIILFDLIRAQWQESAGKQQCLKQPSIHVPKQQFDGPRCSSCCHRHNPPSHTRPHGEGAEGRDRGGSLRCLGEDRFAWDAVQTQAMGDHTGLYSKPRWVWQAAS